MISKIFDPEATAEALEIFREEIPLATWETVYVTILATLFAVIIGLPLGVLLVVGEKDGIRPLPAPFMQGLNLVINLLRSVPFLILMILVFPLTRRETCGGEPTRGRSKRCGGCGKHGCVAVADHPKGDDT